MGKLIPTSSTQMQPTAAIDAETIESDSGSSYRCIEQPPGIWCKPDFAPPPGLSLNSDAETIESDSGSSYRCIEMPPGIWCKPDFAPPPCLSLNSSVKLDQLVHCCTEAPSFRSACESKLDRESRSRTTSCSTMD